MTNTAQSNQSVRFALLIDAENTSPSSDLIKNIVRAVEKYGLITIRRIYGDWSNQSLKSWQSVALEHALRQMHFGSKPGKNSTDIALVVDAMDILHHDDIQGFCLVTSDSDYTALAMHIRHSHRVVIGVGKRDTHANFVTACNEFMYLDALASASQPVKKPAAPKSAAKPVAPKVAAAKPVAPKGTAPKAATPKPDVPKIIPSKAASPDKPAGLNKKEADLLALAREVMNTDSDQEGWVLLSKFGSRLRQIKPGFQVQDYCDKSRLKDLIEAYPKLFEMGSRNNADTVRLIIQKAATPKLTAPKVDTLDTGVQRADSPKAAPAPKKPGLNEKEAALYRLSWQAMSLTPEPAGWMLLADFSKALRQVKPGFTPRDYYDAGKLSNLIRVHPILFEMRSQSSGDMIRILALDAFTSSGLNELTLELYALSSNAMMGASTEWVTLEEFSSRLLGIKPDFDARYYHPQVSLRRLIEANPELFALQIDDGAVMVRLL